MIEPLIIEARPNEDESRDGNPNVPYAPREIVEDARRCEAAGATMLHWHVRDAAGASVDDPEAHRRTIRELRQETSLILCPTRMSVVAFDLDAAAGSLGERQSSPSGDRPDMVPVTFGPVNTGRFPEDELRSHSRTEVARLLAHLDARGVGVSAVCFDLGHVRTARAYVDAGLVKPALWQFVFTGPEVPAGAAPELQALLTLVAALPEGARWSVTGAFGVDIFPLAAHAVVLGGHVSAGLGDNAYSRFGIPDNAAVIGKLAEVASTVGRAVATSDEARAMLGVSRD